MYTGTTRECLSHLVQEQGFEAVRNKLIPYTGASRKTVGDWLKAKSFPLSLYFIKVRSFLQQVGYTVSDYEALPSELKKLSDLLGRGLVTPDEANVALEYHDPYEVIRLVSTSGRQVLKSRRLAIERLYAKHRPAVVPMRVVVSGEDRKSEAVLVQDVTLAGALTGLRAFIALTLPIAEELLNASSEARHHFRQEMGAEHLFHFSNELGRFSKIVNALCSEKAREVVNIPSRS